jgi:Kef-type K+ transport system membrane component KefB
MLNNKKIFLWLFAILYISVAFVSTFHAISFFGLANQMWIAVMLAITFEIGQAAVLFSILTNATKNKVIPWVLMTVLTIVQVLGNVYSSYKYLITNSETLLQYFKEPIFVWMDMPDQQCNVILTYIIGAILPIVSLLMTSMVTGYLNREETKQIESDKQENLTNAISDINNSLSELEDILDKKDDVIDDNIDKPEVENEESRFINLEN